MKVRVQSYLISTLPVLGVIIIWLLLEPMGERFGGVSTVLLSLGQVSGLVGVILFSLSLILNSRVSLLTKIGISEGEICKIHHNYGLLATLTLFSHPLFLAVNTSLFSVYEAARLLLPIHDLVSLFGFASLFIIILVTLLIDSFKKFRGLWLWLHRLSLVAYFFGILHYLFVTSDISRHSLLKYYLIFWSVAGLLSFAYQRLVLHGKSVKVAQECQK